MIPPGPYSCRWAPCVRDQDPGQGQLPSGSYRPRGTNAPNAPRSALNVGNRRQKTSGQIVDPRHDAGIRPSFMLARTAMSSAPRSGPARPRHQDRRPPEHSGLLFQEVMEGIDRPIDPIEQFGALLFEGGDPGLGRSKFEPKVVALAFELRDNLGRRPAAYARELTRPHRRAPCSGNPRHPPCPGARRNAPCPKRRVL
jgi:hypothetical protein